MKSTPVRQKTKESDHPDKTGSCKQINYCAAPWFSLTKQKSRQCRDLENNPHTYEHVADGGRNMLSSCVSMSEGYNVQGIYACVRYFIFEDHECPDIATGRSL